mmetsp:Transcript_24175/g.75582  ORF Transcript_24175/g.75582 Transcript_24175/m.75582 type:complete len:282 (-) Transcript_24175:998-1843(-)
MLDKSMLLSTKPEDASRMRGTPSTTTADAAARASFQLPPPASMPRTPPGCEPVARVLAAWVLWLAAAGVRASAALRGATGGVAGAGGRPLPVAPPRVPPASPPAEPVGPGERASPELVPGLDPRIESPTAAAEFTSAAAGAPAPARASPGVRAFALPLRGCPPCRRPVPGKDPSPCLPGVAAAVAGCACSVPCASRNPSASAAAADPFCASPRARAIMTSHQFHGTPATPAAVRSSPGAGTSVASKVRSRMSSRNLAPPCPREIMWVSRSGVSTRVAMMRA